MLQKNKIKRGRQLDQDFTSFLVFFLEKQGFFIGDQR